MGTVKYGKLSLVFTVSMTRFICGSLASGNARAPTVLFGSSNCIVSSLRRFNDGAIEACMIIGLWLWNLCCCAQHSTDVGSSVGCVVFLKTLERMCQIETEKSPQVTQCCVMPLLVVLVVFNKNIQRQYFSGLLPSNSKGVMLRTYERMYQLFYMNHPDASKYHPFRSTFIHFFTKALRGWRDFKAVRLICPWLSCTKKSERRTRITLICFICRLL